jgi:hypothetical protein
MIFSLAVILTACSGGISDTPEAAAKAMEESPSVVENIQPKQQEIESSLPSFPNLWVEEIPRMDDQGAVEVEIVPLNPNNPGHTLDFRVALNTHSVDLSMDLAALATLETDTGINVQASLWDAPLGGHHVSGILSFPSGVDGKAVLADASKMTIKLADVDAPERVFVWER